MLKRLYAVMLMIQFAGVMNLAQAQQSTPVCLRLRANVQVFQPVVKLVDVIDSAPELLPRELREIDLCLIQLSGESIALDRQFIKLRLALCSDNRDIVLTGAEECQVQRIETAELTEASLEHFARLEVARLTDFQGEDVQVKVLQPVFRTNQRDVNLKVPLRFDFDFPRHSIWGRVSVQARAFHEDELVWSERVGMSVSRKCRVLAARRNISRDELVTPVMFEMQSTFTSEKIESPAIEQVIGKRSVKVIPAGSVVSADDFAEVQPANRDVVIHTRDAVRLVAKTRGLKFVVPRTQAMQSGRVGQLIRVKNLESNRIVTARVVAAGEAVVDLK
ncbi:flagellar basal body P-ring formation chaperone FlgA [Thalassoglobus sp. JC818]|uniref:flagellar basal body P-ring formation chaperone FlgA n=1 Tax=Thalassoglobus sp. JC818 TaxID=3232136 RepID=UPI003458EB37